MCCKKLRDKNESKKLKIYATLGYTLLHKLPVPLSGLPCPISKLFQHIIGILPVVFKFAHQHAVSAEPVPIQLTEIRYQLCAQRVQVDVAHQLQQVRVFLAQNGLVPVLKQVPASPVPQVEADGIARQKPPHDIGNGNNPGAQQKMKMI
jgi:hypothetical protein